MHKRGVLTIFVSLLLTGTIPVAHAQTTIPTPTATQAASQVVADTEAERNKQLAKNLSLNLPDVTNDPNYPITFIDPTKKGVEITIGDKVTSNAPSPFLLPNLGIGQYQLAFKFTDKDGNVKVLSKTLIVAPKPPVFDQTIKTSVVRPNQIVLTGTGLPQSTVLLIVNSTYSYRFSVNQEGKWEFILPEPQAGKNNIMGFIIRNGFISDASTVLTVEYKLHEDGQPATQTNTASPLLDTLKQVYKNVTNFINNNPNEFYIITGITASVIIVLFAISIRREMDKKQEEKSIAELFGNFSNKKTILDVVSPAKIKRDENKIKKEKDPEKEDEVKKEKTEIKEADSEDNEKTIGNNQTLVADEELKLTVPQKTEKPKIDISNKKLPKKQTASPETKEETKPTAIAQKSKKADKKQKKIEVADNKKEGATKIGNAKDTLENENDIETTKKILTKEEFLKQFRTKNEKNDK